MPRITKSILAAIFGRGSEPPARVIVGLGNPGPEYSRTRHNIGFWCIDRIAADYHIELSRRHRLAVIGEGVIADRRVALVKPRTFVNRSGDAVRYLSQRYSLTPGDIIVICDEMALPLATLRLRAGGGAAGHNGLKSVIDAVGSQDFPRVRIGIGRPQDGSDNISHVLSPMPEDDEAKVMEAVERSARLIECLLAEGVDAAMNRFN